MKKETDKKRRKLIAATTIIGGAGVVGVMVPFIAYMNPSERSRSAGAPITIDFSQLVPGQQLTAVWHGKPIWVLRRTQQNLEDLRKSTILRGHLRDPDSEVETQQPAYARNTLRSIRPEYLVVIAICTHLGCVPTYRPKRAPKDLGPDWPGGYYCPCHGSRFDLAGRVYKNVPAPTNLVIPPYHYLSDTKVIIGEDPVSV